MPHTRLTKREGQLLVKLIIVGMILQLGVVSYVWWSGYQGRKDLVSYQQAGCERSKLDRKDSADFQMAHKTYINKVVLAQSVKEDVKKAAREAVDTYNRTSAGLAARSKIVCSDVFPEASIFP